jgi:glycosidase
MTETANPAWVQDAVFYQIFPERFANGDLHNDPSGAVPWDTPPTRENFFGGDLQGILDHLDYIADLGATALYLTPVFAAASSHKYDTSDYLAVDPAFGSTDLLRRLVAACHARGLRVVLDAVFNHCGDSFWAFQDVVARGAASSYADWFHDITYPVQFDPPSYQTCGGAAFLPKLNLGNHAVREHLLHVARYWIETCDIDGWRLDVPWKAPFDFWRKFRAAVKAIKPDAYIVGETWRDTAHWLAGDTCDGVMNYPLRDYILDYCVRDTMDAEDFDHFTARLRAENGPAGAPCLNLLGSHDTPRLMTLCGGNVHRARLAAVMQFTLPGAPMVYYGDEIGMLGENDPDCRRTMRWDPAQWNEDMVSAIRTLSGARRDHAALRRGSVETLRVFNGLYAFRRCTDDDEVVVVANPRGPLADVTIACRAATAALQHQTWQELLSGRLVERAEDGFHFDLLPEQSALVLVPAQ